MKRIGKKRHIEEEAESWAVSYADLLMVLMSFFIVFFNIDDSGEKTIVDIIARGFKKDDARIPAGGRGSELGVLKGLEEAINKNGSKIKVYHQVGDLENAFGNAKENSESDPMSGVDALMKEKQKKEVMAQRGLLIELSDDIFHIGAYELNSYVKNEIDQVLAGLDQYKNEIQIVAIGHADKIPMSASRKVIDSNFILASLRASKAVKYITSKGFDPYWVSGKAVSVENRSTRSLSIRVVKR